MGVTMKDVASAAGVSSMTVSNVLTGRNPVSRETRERVLEVIERTGYQVNVAARSLRRGRTAVVGLAVPDVSSHYFGMLASRLVDRLGREGFRVVIEQTGASREGELAAVTDSRVNAYDGLVLSALGLTPDDVAALAGTLPVVVLGERQDLDRVDHVSMSNVAGAAAAADLLLRRGARRLVAVGMPSPAQLRARPPLGNDAVRLRLQGVRRAVRAVPGATLDTVCARTQTLADGVALAHEALRARPDLDGLVCATDTLALGALRGLADRGVRVPADVLVVGFDDVPQGRYNVPSLSTVSPGHEEVVDRATRLLLRRIQDRDVAPERFTAPHQLVERESTRGPGFRPGPTPAAGR